MDDKRFELLVELLKLMEKNDLKGEGVDETIVSLMDKFDDQLTKEQKSLLMKEFVKYARKEHEPKRDLKKKLEEQLYLADED